MLQRGGRLLLSPSDLNNFLACEHRTALDLARARGEILLERIPRPDAELVAERGREHERSHLARLKERGLDVVEIDGEAAAEATVEAMKRGADVIHQATFTAGAWRGAADFLLKVRVPSELGAYSYEPADAKLATHPKPYVIFQLLFYAAMVGETQGLAPERVHVVLGTDETRSFRPRDFQAYADRVQGRFFRTLQAYRKGAPPPYPYPVEHCAYCDWWARCRDRRRADDHLSLVAGITRAQTVRLEEAGRAAGHRPRRRALRRLGAGDRGPDAQRAAPAGLAAGPQPRHRRAAARAPARRARPRLLAPAAAVGRRRLLRHRGRSLLGPREGLEYLFGSLTEDGYEPLWAHDRAQERAMFERWVDWITARLERHPDLHVYHYNHYEPTALKALMARYGTREAEVDDLLRRKVFVDLYTVVRQALRIGTESYSLKAVEAMYPFERDAEVTEAGGSILAYQEYLGSRDGALLEAIADYNADDCRSTEGLRDWLLAERGAVGYHDVAPPSPPSEQQLARHAEVERLEAALLSGGEDPGKQLLADLLQYHRREARPEWWAYFDRLGRTAAELRDDDPEAIGDLVPADDVPLGEVAQSYLHPLRFPPQQHKLSPGIAVDPVTQRGYEIPRIDDEAGLVWLKRGKASQYKPLPTALIPPKPIPQTAQQAALRALAEQATGTVSGPSAAFELLLRMPPRLRGETLGERVANLGGSVLFIQGPPGSGKTLHGRAADLRAAGPRHARRRRGDLAQGDREPARGGRARGGGDGHVGARPQEVRRRQPRVGLRERPRPLLGRRLRVPARRRGGQPDRRHAVAVGARGAARRGRRAVRRRGRADGARRRAGDRRRRARDGAARRPAAARARLAGHPPARLRRVGARAPARRPRDRPARRRRVPRADLAHAPRRLPLRVLDDVRGAARGGRGRRAPVASPPSGCPARACG